jgi:acetoin utilization protein AcuB
MDVRHYMTRNPVTVGPNDSLRKVRTLMRQGRLRRLPVVENQRVIGIVTDRDVWERSPTGVNAEEHPDSRDLTDHLRVMGIMSLQPLTVTPSTPIVEAARRLRAGRVGALLVVEDGMLVGILTKGNLIDALIDGYSDAAVSGARSSAPPSSDIAKRG